MTTALLVEGNDDRDFVSALLVYMKNPTLERNSKTVQQVLQEREITVVNCEGSTNLATQLEVFAKNTIFDTIAILFDSDSKSVEKFQEITSSLRDLNLPVPLSQGEFAGEKRRTIVKLIEPHDLESLVWRAFDTQDLLTLRNCVEDFMGCLSQNDISPDNKNLYKTRVKAFLAAYASRSNRIALSIGGAVKEDWFPFSHPNFDDLKTFLHSL